MEGDNQSKLKAYNAKRDRIPDAVFFFKSAIRKVTTTWVELELNKKNENDMMRSLSFLMNCSQVND